MRSGKPALAITAIAGVLVSVGVQAPASADGGGTWHQSFGRTGADAVCEAPSDETPWQSTFTGQRTWGPSWAWWVNDGQGGWTCDRWITWAQPTASAAFSGCRYGGEADGTAFYVPFSSTSATSSSTQWVGDSAVITGCGADGGGTLEGPEEWTNWVYTTTGDQQVLCDALVDVSVAAAYDGADEGVFACMIGGG